MRKEYSIKDVSEIFNITTNKVRFYEKKGLIKPKRKSESDYRYFVDEDLVKLQTILMYRKLNLSIENIKDLFEDDSKNNALNHYQKQWEVVNREIHKLKLLKNSLEEIMDGMYEKENEEYSECVLNTTKQMTKIWSIKESWKDQWDFDGWARTYDSSVKRDRGSIKMYKNYEQILDTVYDKAIKNSHDNPRVLEIGVGTGNLARRFLQSEYDIMGLDQSREMLNVCKEKNPKLKVRLGDFLKIPFENKTFDVIVSTYAFHHLNNEEKEVAMGEMIRVLKRDGKIIIGDLMFESYKDEESIKKTLSQEQLEEVEDEYYSNIEQLEYVVKKFNMNIIKTRIDEFMFIVEIY